jgi:hypothetical protein
MVAGKYAALPVGAALTGVTDMLADAAPSPTAFTAFITTV